MTSQEFQAARIALGLTVSEMAAIIGVTPRAIQRFEADQEPKWRRITMIRRLRAYLDRHWSPGWLENRRRSFTEEAGARCTVEPPVWSPAAESPHTAAATQGG